MSYTSKLLIPVLAVALFLPFISHAQTTTNTQLLTMQAEIAQLQQEVAQLQAELQARQGGIATSTGILFTAQITQFTLPVSMHVDEAGGGLRVTYLGLERTTTPVPASDPFSQPLGKFALNFSPCAGYYCTSSQYPTMITELWPGQTTQYLNYNILLNTLHTDSNSATVTVVKH